MTERPRLAFVVWGVLLSQVFPYSGLEDTVRVLGGEGILAGTAFLVAEFGSLRGLRRGMGHDQ